MSHQSTKENMSKMELMERCNSKDDSIFQQDITTTSLSITELEKDYNIPKAVKEFDSYRSVKHAELMWTNKIRRSKEGCDNCNKDCSNGCCNADCKIYDMKLETYEEFEGKKPTNDRKPQWHPCYNCPKYNSSCPGIESAHLCFNKNITHNIYELFEEEKISKETFQVLKEVGLTTISDKLYKRIDKCYTEPFHKPSGRSKTISSFMERLNDMIADEFLYQEGIKKPNEKTPSKNIRFKAKKTPFGYIIKIKKTGNKLIITDEKKII